MKIDVFTIRDRKTKEIIHAEGVSHAEFYSNFELDKSYFTDEEWNKLNNLGAWNTRGNEAYFDEEIRHLTNYNFEKIVFNPYEEYEFISDTELKKVK